MPDHDDSSEEEISILVQFLSAKDILIGDVVSSDPYVQVKLGKETVHKTKYIPKTLNPLWTPKQDNTFALKQSIQNFKDHDGLVFYIKDYDMMSSDEELGSVKFSFKEIQQAEGKVVTKRILPPKNQRNMKGKCGVFTFQARHATPADFKSLKKKEGKQLFVTATK